MKFLKLYESFEDNASRINGICRQYDIKNYKINPDGSIDVYEKVAIPGKGLTKLPLKFNKVNYFDCSFNNLTSLEGSPVEVMSRGFFCYRNKLTSFKFAPKIIRGYFDCRFNEINSFEYFPSYVGSDFWCSSNPIFEVWILFTDIEKIELLNDFDIFRDEDTKEPVIIMDRLNDFLIMIGKKEVRYVNQYKSI